MEYTTITFQILFRHGSFVQLSRIKTNNSNYIFKKKKEKKLSHTHNRSITVSEWNHTHSRKPREGWKSKHFIGILLSFYAKFEKYIFNTIKFNKSSLQFGFNRPTMEFNNCCRLTISASRVGARLTATGYAN